MAESTSTQMPVYWQVAACSLLYLLWVSPVTPPSNHCLGAATPLAWEPSTELA